MIGDSKTAKSKVDFDSIIVRFGGEIWTKKTWTRLQYERLVLKNIKRVVKFHDFPITKIVRTHGRLFIKTDKAEEASRKIANVFGISSLSPAVEISSKIDEIIEKSLILASQNLENKNTFAVRCRRVGSHSYESRDVCQMVGQKILEEFGEKFGLKVDLKNPDITFGIDIREEKAFIFDEVVEGQGGLPLGGQPHLIGVLNGEINSLVACWSVMKRGCPIIPVYFDNKPYTDDKETEKAIDYTKTLLDWATGFPRRIYVVPNEQNLKTMLDKCPSYLTCILCRRLVFKIAEGIAEMFRAEGIVTGETIEPSENLTLHNLNLTSQAAEKFPIYRPILGFERQEIEEMATKIGTNSSLEEKRTCLAESHTPHTMIELQEILEAEKKLDLEQMIDKSMKSLKVMNL